MADPLDLDALEHGLVLPEGATFEVGDDAPLLVDYFIMGRNSKIVFKPGITKWELTARRCRFYAGAVIDADGPDAPADAPPGISGIPSGVGATQQGRQGSSGTDGEDGGNAVDVTLKLGIELIENVTISACGGDAQPGGSGQKGGGGGRADVSKNKNGGKGGTGGRGGKGGQGGDAGTVVIEWWEVDGSSKPAISVDDISSAGLKVVAKPGNGAPGGPGGPGGNGGPGKCEKILFAKVCKGGGPAGDGGSGGPNGTDGKSVAPTITKKPK